MLGSAASELRRHADSTGKTTDKVQTRVARWRLRVQREWPGAWPLYLCRQGGEADKKRADAGPESALRRKRCPCGPHRAVRAQRGIEENASVRQCRNLETGVAEQDKLQRAMPILKPGQGYICSQMTGTWDRRTSAPMIQEHILPEGRFEYCCGEGYEEDRGARDSRRLCGEGTYRAGDQCGKREMFGKVVDMEAKPAKIVVKASPVAAFPCWL